MTVFPDLDEEFFVVEEVFVEIFGLSMTVMMGDDCNVDL